LRPCASSGRPRRERGDAAAVANDDTEALARVVLQTANRTQAEGSSVRLVVPRAPEVVDEVGVELTEAQLLAVEEYLHHHGYVVPVDMGLSWGTYTITPAGFEWLEGGMPEPSSSSSAKDPVLELAERPGEEAALEAALRAELEEEQRRMEELERELDEPGQREEPLGAPGRAAQETQGAAEPHPVTGGAREGTEKRQQQGRMPRRLRRELNEARKHLEEERPWWRRVFGG
jgi:hypothetical protein